jgi:hypothetical protein
MEYKPCNLALPLVMPIEGVCLEDSNEFTPRAETSSVEKLRRLRMGMSFTGSKKLKEEMRKEEEMKRLSEVRKEEEKKRLSEVRKEEEKREEEMNEDKELDEKDVEKYLLSHKDNIILVFGHKIYSGHRSVIKKSIKQPENIFTDESGKVYYQVMGRHLVDDVEIKCLLKDRLSIFNISTLKNVIKVTNKVSPMIHSRGVYSIDAYTLDEYQEILSA